MARSILDDVQSSPGMTRLGALVCCAAARQDFLVEPFPASTAVGVIELAVPNLQIEIDAVAVRYRVSGKLGVGSLDLSSEVHRRRHLRPIKRL
jgi:hypothetical protein